MKKSRGNGDIEANSNRANSIEMDSTNALFKGLTISK